MFEVHAAYSLDKQLALAALLKNSKGWRFDMERGTITFGEKQSFPVQVLGTESEGDATWLWSWANLESGIPREFQAAAETMREFGKAHGVAELAQPELPLSKTGGDYLSLIACGICKADAFYRGPYAGGAVFLLLQLPENLKPARDSAQRVATVFTELISRYAVNHRNAFLNYLHFKGYRADSGGCEIVGVSLSGEQVGATFDKLGRLIKIRAAVKRAE